MCNAQLRPCNKISFINECIENNAVALRFINSEENVADALTKLLPKRKLAKHRRVLHHGHEGKEPPSLSRIDYNKMVKKAKAIKGGKGKQP